MYIPEVPYDVVSQVLDKMNGDSSASNYKKRSFHIEWESTCDDISFNHMLRRRPTLTPGYTTTDDLGSDGKGSFIHTYINQAMMSSIFVR